MPCPRCGGAGRRIFSPFNTTPPSHAREKEYFKDLVRYEKNTPEVIEGLRKGIYREVTFYDQYDRKLRHHPKT
jgi:hypothetical protein